MTENKNYRTQTSTSERNKLHLVFPGIWLMFQDVEVYSFSPWGKVPSGLLEITHCREGRLEYQDSCQAFFLGEGDLSIRQTRKEKAALLCPVKRYRGLSVLIHPEQAPPCTSCFLRDVNVSLAELYEKFCGEGRPFIMRATPQLEHIFAQLYQVPQSIQRGYFKVKVLELLLFLSCLEPTMSQGEQRACTPFQVRLAREVIAYVDAHRDQRVTAAQLGRELGVSTEQLRASVQQVYGKPLYQCIRAYKMRVAARLLRETDTAPCWISPGSSATGTAANLPPPSGRCWGSPLGSTARKIPQHFGVKIPQIGAETRRRIKYNQVRQQGRSRTPSPWAAERALTPVVFLFAS